MSESANRVMFSVVIPAYNAARHVERALDSVRTQTFQDFEVLVTNDGSTDRTAEVLVTYGRMHPDFPLRVLDQANGGIGAARNHAMRFATGRWTAFLDADDCWRPEKLERVAEFIHRSPVVDVVYHDAREVWADGRTRPLVRGILAKPYYENLLFGVNRLSPSATAVRTEKLREVGGFWERRKGLKPEEDLHGSEDSDLWLRLARTGSEICYLPLNLEDYYRGEGSLSLRVDYHGDRALVNLRNHFAWLRQHGTHPPWLVAYHSSRKTAQNFISRGYMHVEGGNLGAALRSQVMALRCGWWWWKTHANSLRLLLLAIRSRGRSRQV